MKKIKIIDLFNKIAKGEKVPKRIEYDKEVFEFDGRTYFKIDDPEDSIYGYIYYNEGLNTEAKILLEEDTTEEIEEIDYYTTISAVDGKFQDNVDKELLKHARKINELVRAYNKLNNTTYKAENCMTD